MGLLDRFRGEESPRRDVTPPRLSPSAMTMWLPGDVEVQVAGESHHKEVILAAQLGASPDGPLVAVLVPEPTNAYDSNAIAVYVHGGHVGYLPAEVAGRVRPALSEFAQAHEGRYVSCPAQICDHGVGPQVVLLLDCTPLGIAPEAFEFVPELARILGRLLERLDTPAPTLSGLDSQAQMALTEAENDRSAVEADYDRRRDAWPRVERSFYSVVERLVRANDPSVSAAWLGLAGAVRYQRGRRDDTLAAYVEALHYDRTNGDAWSGLIDMASAAPHVPTLVSLFARIPFGAREHPLQQLLATADGHDRLGNMSRSDGARLRNDLFELIESQGDARSTAFLAGKASLEAEKDGDLDVAIVEWRRAVAAGSTDGKVADRFSVWLTKQGAYAEAASVLRQALAVPSQTAGLRGRLEKRLTRCERLLRHAG